MKQIERLLSIVTVLNLMLVRNNVLKTNNCKNPNLFMKVSPVTWLAYLL